MKNIRLTRHNKFLERCKEKIGNWMHSNKTQRMLTVISPPYKLYIFFKSAPYPYNGRDTLNTGFTPSFFPCEVHPILPKLVQYLYPQPINKPKGE